MATTTGFATVDYSVWPLFAPALMLLLACFSTSAGSTGGGIKMARALLLLKQAQRELAHRAPARGAPGAHERRHRRQQRAVLALEAGVPTKTYVLNVLHRLLDGKPPAPPVTAPRPCAWRTSRRPT